MNTDKFSYNLENFLLLTAIWPIRPANPAKLLLDSLQERGIHILDEGSSSQCPRGVAVAGVLAWFDKTKGLVEVRISQ